MTWDWNEAATQYPEKLNYNILDPYSTIAVLMQCRC